jgi:DNA-binding MarR family transcriptional regulator
MKTKQLAKLMDAGRCLARTTGNDRLELQTMQTFLIVCISGGEVSMQEIEKQLDFGQSTTSRNVAKLGIGASLDEPGPRLVEAFEDPAYRRRKLVRLTARGQKLAEELTTILER